MTSYYLDTYALVELGKANPNYHRYLRGMKVITSKLNLMELAYYLRRESRDSEVGAMFSRLSRYHIDASDAAFLNAAALKFKYRKRKLSYIDCLGYSIAKENGAKFLTGDEQFSDIDNVEFVK